MDGSDSPWTSTPNQVCSPKLAKTTAGVPVTSEAMGFGGVKNDHAGNS